MRSILFIISFLFAQAANACDIVLSAGANLHVAVATYPGDKICLNAGTYNLGSTTLSVPAGTRIEGLAANKDDVVLNSSAARGIQAAGNNITLKNFLLNGSGPASGFGILTYGRQNILIWSLRVQNFNINIGVHTSTNVDIWDTFTRYNGDISNTAAEPNIWIYSSDDVYILYGEARGRGNGPGGDGEVAAHDSTNVVINNLHAVDVGASAIYMVNCDNCSLTNAVIHRPNEWGIDVVNGSDNFQAEGNTVLMAKFGGAIFDEAGSTGGTFIDNIFQNNRQLGVGSCNGINVIGSISGVVSSGNYSNPPGEICVY